MRPVRCVTAVAVALGLSGCTGPAADDAAPLPAAVDLLTAHRSPYAAGEDSWEVWLCDVPLTTGDELYAADPWRLERSVEDVVDVLGPSLSAWWDRQSGGRVVTSVTPGGRVAVDDQGGGEECVAAAMSASVTSADGLLVVATAAHRPDVPGGWGRPGDCGDEQCGRAPASTTGRAVYVGAADLHPSWGDRTPLDLIEHEMGHALDLPHSGVPADGRYTSALDVMSDSAARRTADDTTPDAGGTLAVNLFALGWLDVDDLTVVENSTTVDLSSDAGGEGSRLAVVPLDDHRLLTVELRGPIGLDTHLPETGVSVHLVDQAPTACDDPVEPWRDGACTGRFRLQRPLVGDPPYTDLLGVSESVAVEGWRITVEKVEGSTSRVALTPR